MSKIETMTIGGRQLRPHEIAYVDTMAKFLAKESDIDVDWIKKILLKTFPDGGIGVHPSTIKDAHTFISGKFPGRFLYCFKPCLLEAMKWLDKQSIVDFFSGDLQHLKILEDRYDAVVNEVQFISFKKLIPAAKKFKNYLEEEFQTIIETGSILLRASSKGTTFSGLMGARAVERGATLSHFGGQDTSRPWFKGMPSN